MKNTKKAKGAGKTKSRAVAAVIFGSVLGLGGTTVAAPAAYAEESTASQVVDSVSATPSPWAASLDDLNAETAEAEIARERLAAKYAEAFADRPASGGSEKVSSRADTGALKRSMASMAKGRVPASPQADTRAAGGLWFAANWLWNYVDNNTGLGESVWEMFGLPPSDPDLGGVLDDMTSQIIELREQIDALSRMIEQVLDGQALSDFRNAQRSAEGEISVINSDLQIVQFLIDNDLEITPQDARDLRISTYQSLSRLEAYVNGEGGALPLAMEAIDRFDSPVSTLEETFWAPFDEYRDAYKRAMLSALATLSYADDVEGSTLSRAALAVKSEDVASIIEAMYERAGVFYPHGSYLHTKGSQAMIASMGSTPATDSAFRQDWKDGIRWRFHASGTNANPAFWGTYHFTPELERARDAFVASAASDGQTFEQSLRAQGMPTAYAGTQSVGYLLDSPQFERNSNGQRRAIWYVVTVKDNNVSVTTHRTAWTDGNPTRDASKARDAWNIQNSGQHWMVMQLGSGKPLNDVGRLSDWNEQRVRDAARSV